MVQDYASNRTLQAAIYDRSELIDRLENKEKRSAEVVPQHLKDAIVLWRTFYQHKESTSSSLQSGLGQPAVWQAFTGRQHHYDAACAHIFLTPIRPGQKIQAF